MPDGSTTVEGDFAIAETSFQSTGENKSPPPPQGFARPTTMSLDHMVEKFIALRDKVAEIKKRHADELNPYALVMGSLEGWMLDALNTHGMSSMRANAGTFFTTTRTSAKVTSWATVLDYIREKEAWELLEARVNKTAAEAIINETGAAIPGVTTSTEIVLNVRRS